MHGKETIKWHVLLMVEYPEENLVQEGCKHSAVQSGHGWMPRGNPLDRTHPTRLLLGSAPRREKGSPLGSANHLADEPHRLHSPAEAMEGKGIGSEAAGHVGAGVPDVLHSPLSL